MNNLTWSLYQIWNESLEQGRPERKMEVRDYMWAGEIGGSFIDRYLKMNATVPTNPPNARSKRKFEAGNLMEWVVEMVLLRAGILVQSQEWVAFQYPDLLKVTGRLDHEAGGEIDWEKAESEVLALRLPEFFDRATKNIIAKLKEKYPNGMNKIVLEVKSVSAIQFDMKERLNAPAMNHACQLFHYLKAKNYTEGHIVYICRDDLRMLEFGVFNPSKWEDIYKADITKMTNFIKNKIEPEKELKIVFNEEDYKFNKNWKVEYSNYLQMLYGYERPDLFVDEVKPLVAQFNRVLVRCLQGKEMTKLNLSVIDELKKQFPNFDEIVKQGIKLGKAKEVVEESEATNGNGL
jgi:hypothetical protein